MIFAASRHCGVIAEYVKYTNTLATEGQEATIYLYIYIYIKGYKSQEGQKTTRQKKTTEVKTTLRYPRSH